MTASLLLSDEFLSFSVNGIVVLQRMIVRLPIIRESYWESVNGVDSFLVSHIDGDLSDES
jgi:hypothetical protein